MSDEATAVKEFSAEVSTIVDKISELNAVKLSELKEAIEDRFDVTAAAGGAIMVAAGAGDAAAEDTEPTEFDVVIKSIGDKKIQVIKEVRTITGLGLKEAKAVVDESPAKAVREKATLEDAERFKKQLEDAGATVELKPA